MKIIFLEIDGCFLDKFWTNFEKKKKRQTLNGRLPPEDSSVFDDSVCVLIVMTWSIVWAKVDFFRFFSFVVVEVVAIAIVSKEIGSKINGKRIPFTINVYHCLPLPENVYLQTKAGRTREISFVGREISRAPTREISRASVSYTHLTLPTTERV